MYSTDLTPHHSLLFQNIRLVNALHISTDCDLGDLKVEMEDQKKDPEVKHTDHGCCKPVRNLLSEDFP